MFARTYRYGLLGRFKRLQTARVHGKKLNEMLTARTPEEQRATFERGRAVVRHEAGVRSKLPVSFYALAFRRQYME
jgi:S-adenosylmethionine:diacylglycerol 3-amino-3-carboxypropyl transferase